VTLFAIAKKVNVPVEVLKSYNGISDPSRLKAGTVIRIPSTHTVAKGDTLYGIARGASVALKQLLALNGLSETSKIKPGDRIYLPGRPGQAPAVASTKPAAASTKPATPPAAAPAATPPAGSPSTRPAVATPAPPGLAWPHPGKREQFRGKFTGLVFHGARGDRVVSATDGEVKSVMPYWGWGKTVIIKSPDGSFFLYAGNEEILVNVGDRVTPGMEIARLGVSPQGGGARLYFCIQGTKGQYIDPEKYFSRSQA
jgi:murein DD-endopeptidase MepM/ murein hydrolase activator NlpD